MKKITVLLLLLSCTLCLSRAQYIDLGSLGSADFTIDPGSIGTFTQTASTVNFTGAALGDQIFGGYTPSNWSSYSDFGIRMTVSGVNPNLPFTITFFDSDFAENVYSGFTTGLLDGVSGVAPLALTSSGANLSSIVGLQIGWDGSATPINVALSDVAAVPEPSTYALLSLAGIALGGYAFRRRRA